MGKVLSSLQSGKTCIAYTAPGTRVALGDEFGEKPGENVENKLVSALRSMGFRYVLDLNFAADVTIMEESSELIHRLKNGGTLPMITSCCPAWVRYCELFYPDLLDNLSTCKSPMGMEGALINSYFLPVQGLTEDDVFTVAITPCTAKEGTEKVDYIVYIWYNVSIKYRRCFYDRTTAEIDAKSIHGNI